MLSRRPVWILPDNDKAYLPFSSGSPYDEKGFIYEALAYINMMQKPNNGKVGLGGIERRIKVDGPGLMIKPAVIVEGNTTGGTVTPDTYVPKAYCFIKKPTLVEIPYINISSEFGPLVTAHFTLQGLNAVGGAYGENKVKIKGTSGVAQKQYFNWINDTYVNDVNIPYSAPWPPILEGEKCELWISSNNDPDFALFDTFYFSIDQSIVIDYHDSGDIEDMTFTYTDNAVSGDYSKTSFTTVDVPSWVFSASTSSFKNGCIGYIEWMESLYDLQSEYTDYTPWELGR